ncbi:MAG: CHRD domain-containing protein [Candidatus Dojkabacteria bacterium]
MPEENKSMMLVIIAAVVIIVIGIIIFVVASNNYNTVTNTPTNNPVSASVNTSKSFVLKDQNGSGQTGTVVLTENGDSTKVSISLINPTSVSEPAHIHLGSCPTPGAVKYPLSNVINGSSVTTINVKFSDLKALGALAVNVHKSAEQSTVYVSCGDLAF